MSRHGDDVKPIGQLFSTAVAKLLYIGIPLPMSRHGDDVKQFLQLSSTAVANLLYIATPLPKCLDIGPM